MVNALLQLIIILNALLVDAVQNPKPMKIVTLFSFDFREIHKNTPNKAYKMLKVFEIHNEGDRHKGKREM